MKLTLLRHSFTKYATVGQLYIDGAWACDTLEPHFIKDMDHTKKIPGQTAIPEGTFTVTIEWSPRFGRKMPRLQKVPFFEGILIHTGNSVRDTAGCILVGSQQYTNVCTLYHSKTAFRTLYSILEKEYREGREIKIHVTNIDNYSQPDADFSEFDSEFKIHPAFIDQVKRIQKIRENLKMSQYERLF